MSASFITEPDRVEASPTSQVCRLERGQHKFVTRDGIGNFKASPQPYLLSILRSAFKGNYTQDSRQSQ